jgi:hypothetical protein
MFKSLDDIKLANERVGYFFSPDTMRFFSSRISRTVYPNAYGTYFVTSERNSEDDDRRYTVRHATPDGFIFTVGEFQQYGTPHQAHKAAKHYQDALVKRPKR